MRLIDADALIPMMRYATTDSEIGVFPIKIGFDAIVEVINSQPTIEPERKKGKWIKGGEQPYFRKHFDIVVCSICNKRGEHRWNYCPNCGTDMRGEQDD